jgi:hypothetical protein
MNSEDLNQIGAIVREEIGASETRLREEMGTLREELRMFLREEIQASETRSHEFARDIEARLVKEMQRSFDRVNRRFESLERRLERVDHSALGMSKSPFDAGRFDDDTFVTLTAQQRAIDGLYRQVAEIRRNLPPQH